MKHGRLDTSRRVNWRKIAITLKTLLTGVNECKRLFSSSVGLDYAIRFLKASK